MANANSLDLTLSAIRHLAIDLDGTLYLGATLFDVTRPFLDTLRQLGIGRTFFTNNSSRSTKQYVRKLNDLGIEADESDLLTSTHCTIEYLRQEQPEVRRVYVLGTPALREEFVENGFVDTREEVNGGGDEPDAVVVGFDTTLTYDRLCRAAWWISRGKPFIATLPDRTCPTDKPTLLPECGALCKLLTHATGREPDAVLGKPDPRMLRGVMRRHQLRADEIAVVGDRLYTDIAMARSAGAVGVLVLTGDTTAEQARSAQPQPDLVIADV
ncbi:MAG: HAD-IIA family hydrolase, partial [Tepidisphaeraceae bacterium]